MADSSSDELYTLRNAFFLSNFHEALAEADTIARPKSETLRLELDVLKWRSHIGLGNYACVSHQQAAPNAPRAPSAASPTPPPPSAQQGDGRHPR